MEYATPTLRVVGTAQSLVLGGAAVPTGDSCGSPSSSPCLEVLGLDD